MKAIRGEKGDSVVGWSPLIISVVRNGLVYLYLSDWVGGSDLTNKPTTTGFLSPNGIVATIDEGAVSVSADYALAIAQLNDAVEQRMLITATTSDVPEGSRLYYTDARVRATTLTGLSLAASSDVTSSDSLLTAIGKLQAQSSLKQLASTLKADVLGLSITGYAVGVDSTLTATDTILGAFGKVQGQINSRQLSSTLPSDVRSVLLTGLSTSTNSAIAATDSVLTAFGKLQAQINSKQASSTLQADVRATPMTGLATTTNSTVLATDTLLVSIGKLQAQINSLVARVTALEPTP